MLMFPKNTKKRRKGREKAKTKEEKLWMAKIALLPCCVNNKDCCRKIELNHITKNGRRMGHLYTIPLCFNHHQNQTPLPYGESLGKGKREFQAKYGTEMEMWERTKIAVDIGQAVRDF